MKRFLTILLLFAALAEAPAQETTGQDLPEDVAYLMPSFMQGTVYIRGQGPAQGKLNICAVDNTLRFIDDSGTELAAADHESILRVIIDTVSFVRHQNAFLRLCPVEGDMGIAVKRNILIITDAKSAAYGGTSQTSAIREYGVLYAEGGIFELNKNKKYPYKVSESLFVYKGDNILPPTRNNLRKLFPDRRDEIDAYFKSKRSFPENQEEARALLKLWGGF